MEHTSPANWKARKLDQLGSVGRGRSRHRPRNEPSLYGGEYPFFQTGDIKAANLYLSEHSQTYNEKGLAQSKLWGPGTLCITIAANIADTAILAIPGCFPDSVIGFIAEPAKADVRFIKYYIDLIKLDMQQVSHGTTQDNLSLDKLLRFDFVAPDVEEQRKIAAILSAYDGLIENNLRRIKILEEMAQNLYSEWFVKFRFPGHQRARFTDSPLSRIPEGWEVKRLGEAFLTVLGGTPSRKNPEFWCNGMVPWINSGKVNDLRVTEPSELITELALKKSAAKLMPRGTTLIAITGATLGQVSMLEIQASANQSVVGVISEDENLIEWLYLTISDRILDIINHASGGAQQHINKGIVDDVVVAVPPRNIAEDFRNIAHPLHRQIAGFIFKNTTLRRTRDLLLPRLISGEVDVSELDIKVSEEAAV